ncbi:MAG: isoprenyl transferase [Desulfatiglans sp.]|jgi:undecaprenyl diphosphate synthase|nr:isoprenyl transferase [Desulfatiglans sp.]
MTKLDPKKLPIHVAAIMDGNGRWAKKRMMNRVKGHEEGTESVRTIVRTSRKLGIRYLTLYAFSEENWKRSRLEIAALMEILKRFLKSELSEMLDNGIRLNAIGDIDKLPPDARKVLYETIEKTSANNDMVLTLALSYGARQEIVNAVKEIAARVKSGKLDIEDINDDMIGNSLYTAGIPDPDLLIRTSGEYRISNFLLWQVAYTEIYVTPTLWPDFREKEYLTALLDYEKRERRFGAAD